MPPVEAEVVEGIAVEMDGHDQSSSRELVHTPLARSLIPADSPAEVLEKAAELAGPLADLIARKGLFQQIGGKKHVEISGWQAMGAMLGALGGPSLHAETEWARPVLNEDGLPRSTEHGYDWHARVAVKTSDGAVAGIAEALCCRSESTWAKRPDQAVMSMAETRAESRAYRRAAGWIITMAGYSSTPREEMPDNGQPAEAAPPPALVGDNDLARVGGLLADLLGIGDHDPPADDDGEKDRRAVIAKQVWRELSRITGTPRPTVGTAKAVEAVWTGYQHLRDPDSEPELDGQTDPEAGVET